MASGRVRAGLGTLVAVLTASVPGCSSGRDTRGDSVVVLGDSITAMGHGDMEARLGDRYDLRVDGVFGARAQDRLFAAVDLAAAHPRQAVVNLGTNDALLGTPPDTFAGDLGRVLDAFSGSECVHLVKLNTNLTQMGTSHATEARALNDVIDSLADSHPNVDLVDWDEIQATAADESGKPTALTQDGIHPDDAGQRALTDAVGEALAGCGQSRWPF